MPMTATYTDAITSVLRREYLPLRNAAKTLARHGGTSTRTAENWLAGLHAPSGESLVNLMAECEALTAEVNRLVEERRKARGEK